MNNHIIYLLALAAFLAIAILLHKLYSCMSDSSIASPKPYSFSRVQMVWWSFIVIAGFISIVIASGQVPTFDRSTLILLGIGTLTTLSARLIDISDKQNPPDSGNDISVNHSGQGFLMDILSDNNGVSIHRLQAFLFNFIFGLWFIYRTYKGIPDATVMASVDKISGILPIITDNNLVLLGLSAGTYVALKTTENK